MNSLEGVIHLLKLSESKDLERRSQNVAIAPILLES